MFKSSSYRLNKCIGSYLINIFVVVPLLINLWVNSPLSLTKICCPNKFDFTKETGTKIVEEVDSVANDVQKLLPFIFNNQRRHISQTFSHTDLRFL